MTATPSLTTVDVRTLAPRDRHATVVSTLRGLQAGATLELLSDHDPQPLRQQLRAQLPGGFDWACIDSGPATWRIHITKLAASHRDGQCCGSCGGA